MHRPITLPTLIARSLFLAGTADADHPSQHATCPGNGEDVSQTDLLWDRIFYFRKTKSLA